MLVFRRVAGQIDQARAIGEHRIDFPITVPVRLENYSSSSGSRRWCWGRRWRRCWRRDRRRLGLWRRGRLGRGRGRGTRSSCLLRNRRKPLARRGWFRRYVDDYEAVAAYPQTGAGAINLIGSSNPKIGPQRVHIDVQTDFAPNRIPAAGTWQIANGDYTQGHMEPYVTGKNLSAIDEQPVTWDGRGRGSRGQSGRRRRRRRGDRSRRGGRSGRRRRRGCGSCGRCWRLSSNTLGRWGQRRNKRRRRSRNIRIVGLDRWIRQGIRGWRRRGGWQGSGGWRRCQRWRGWRYCHRSRAGSLGR